MKRARSAVVSSGRIGQAVGATLVFILLSIGSTNIAFADGLRCGTRIISEGDHAVKLLRYCGEPDFAHSRRALRPYHGTTGITYYPNFTEEVWVEEWTYNFGPHKLMRIIRLENGIVREVKHLGYGYTKPRN